MATLLTSSHAHFNFGRIGSRRSKDLSFVVSFFFFQNGDVDCSGLICLKNTKSLKSFALQCINFGRFAKP